MTTLVQLKDRFIKKLQKEDLPKQVVELKKRTKDLEEKIKKD